MQTKSPRGVDIGPSPVDRTFLDGCLDPIGAPLVCVHPLSSRLATKQGRVSVLVLAIALPKDIEALEVKIQVVLTPISSWHGHLNRYSKPQPVQVVAAHAFERGIGSGVGVCRDPARCPNTSLTGPLIGTLA